MEVQVIRVPGNTNTVEIPEGGTVGEALNAANISLGGNESCKLDGNSASASDRCSEGSKVIVAKGAKGNS